MGARKAAWYAADERGEPAEARLAPTKMDQRRMFGLLTHWRLRGSFKTLRPLVHVAPV